MYKEVFLARQLWLHLLPFFFFTLASVKLPQNVLSPPNIFVAYCPFMLCPLFLLFWTRNPEQASLIAEVRLGLVNETWEERGRCISPLISPFFGSLFCQWLHPSITTVPTASSLTRAPVLTGMRWQYFPSLPFFLEAITNLLLLVSRCLPLADSLTPTHNSANSPFSKIIWIGFESCKDSGPPPSHLQCKKEEIKIKI